MQDETKLLDISMDAEAICREEVFTDNRVGTIRKLTPVTADGEADGSREVEFLGSTQIMTPGGALPLSFQISGASLSDAIAGFGAAAQQAVEQTMEELKELQRQAASSIVVPKAGMDPSKLGGGKIQLP